jgi:hypothetical protein
LSLDEIFKVITGCVVNNLTDSVNLKSQGWKRSGLPLAIQILARLFQKVDNVSPEVLDAYGDQNPFSSWHALKHHLAAYVTSLGGSEDPAILWRAMPSKLVATGMAVIVEYDTLNGSASLSQPPQAEPVASSMAPDIMKRDSFAGCFLIFCHPTAFLQTLTGKLEEQGITVDATTKLHNCARIVLMQAVVVEFFINKKKQLRHVKTKRSSHKTLVAVSAGFVGHVFPLQKQLVENRKNLGLSSTRLDKVMWKDAIDSYDSLWNEVSKDPGLTSLHHELYILATKNLRPPSELERAETIVDAWLPEDRMDSTSKALHEIQVDACLNYSNQQALATVVLAGYGIISEQYLDLIKNTRTTLRQLITQLRQAVVGSDDWNKKKLDCQAFVENNELPGNKRKFDFG